MLDWLFGSWWDDDSDDDDDDDDGEVISGLRSTSWSRAAIKTNLVRVVQSSFWTVLTKGG